MIVGGSRCVAEETVIRMSDGYERVPKLILVIANTVLQVL